MEWDKTSTHLVTRSVRSEILCVSSKGNTQGKKHKQRRTRVFPAQERRLRFFYYSIYRYFMKMELPRLCPPVPGFRNLMRHD